MTGRLVAGRLPVLSRTGACSTLWTACSCVSDGSQPAAVWVGNPARGKLSMTTTPAVSPKRSPTTTRCSILRHNILYGHVRAGVCVTDDCVWAALNNPDSQTPRCEDFWRSNPHLIPEATGYVCTPPDGCVRWYAMTYDRCMLDGALWCHVNRGVWRVCARQSTAVQPSGVPCPAHRRR